MLARRFALRTARCLTVLLALAFVACSSDDSNGPAPAPGATLVGSWNATTFATSTDDFIAQGMTLVMTIKNDDTYTFAFTNDLVGACNPGPDCANNGPYTATSTTLTIDPGTVDETVFTYSVAGSTLTMNSSINGTPVTLVLRKL